MTQTRTEGWSLARADLLADLLGSGMATAADVERAAAISPVEGGAAALATTLIREKIVTGYQLEAFRERKSASLRIGNYDVLDRLGAGGMGTVFKARHRRMKRIVALKVLARELFQDASFVLRFQREVETLASLAHPNIVMAFDADEAEVGRFLVMEFVDGQDLATLVKTRGPVSAADAVKFSLQSARGLAYAHQQNVIHRDVKPANLILGVHGDVKVADLGLARLSNELATDRVGGITQAGGILGTVEYMSPEQAVDSTSLDYSTDVYSLGATLHFLLTGAAPYGGASIIAVLLKHRDAPIPSLRAVRGEVPERLDALFHRMMAKTPAQRPKSMAEVVYELEAIAAELRIQAPAGGLTDEFSATSASDGGLQETALSTDFGATIDVSSGDRTQQNSLTVVLVEPSRAQASIIRRYLESVDGATVDLFSTGRETIERLAVGAVDVVVSAMHLKDMTGVQLAQKLRDSRISPPSARPPGFVLISGESEAPALAEVSLSGLAVKLGKPFSSEQLVAAVGIAAGRTLKAGGFPSETLFGGRSFVGRSIVGVGRSRDSLKVLIADDSAAARAHVRGVLAQLGLRNFIDVADGAQAVAAATRERFDLIVTDLNMPLMDGAGFVGYLRQNPGTAKIPIILTTSESAVERLDPVRRWGAIICDKNFHVDVVRGVLDGLF